MKRIPLRRYRASVQVGIHSIPVRSVLFAVTHDDGRLHHMALMMLGRKATGISANFKKRKLVSKQDLDKIYGELLQEAVNSWAGHFRSTLRNIEGAVSWFSDSHGSINSEWGDIFFHTCNVEGANSLYPELVSNVVLERGDRVTFDGHESLGAIHIRGAKLLPTACKVCNEHISDGELVNKFFLFGSDPVHKFCADKGRGVVLQGETK